MTYKLRLLFFLAYFLIAPLAGYWIGKELWTRPQWVRAAMQTPDGEYTVSFYVRVCEEPNPAGNIWGRQIIGKALKAKEAP